MNGSDDDRKHHYFHFFFTMDRVINGGSRFFLRASTLLDSQSQPAMDGVMDWGSDFLQSLQQAIDNVLNWLGSLISGFGTEFTKHKDFLLHVAGVVGVVLAAIVAVWLLWTVISGVVWLLWNVISGVVWLLWNVISGVVWLVWMAIMAIFKGFWKVITTIFCCCERAGRKMMTAPGRNIRIVRSSFESNPASYFRKLRSDQRNGLV
ncbi:hypothetical protein VNO78_22259 [Psophocarpus tetragonolobus]|uniref:Transmembrane protein n=1 Tax=Psophocarpus tetragonolobus TaxID=3891 RepID=A0AAN9XIW9_PSOTE